MEGEVIYRTADNRQSNPVIIMERDLGPYPKEMEREKDPKLPAESQYEKTSLVGTIWNQSNLYSHILNTYIIKWEKRPESHTPSGISKHSNVPDIEQLKRQRQIKYQKGMKRSKRKHKEEQPPTT